MDKNQISIDINANVGGLKRGTAEAEAAVKALGRSFKEPSAALEDVSKKSEQATASFSRLGVGIGLAAGATTGALMVLAKRTIDAADALNNMSIRTDVSVKDLAGLKLIAEQSGTSLDAVGTGVQRLTVSMAQAQNGSKEYAAALQRLGVTARDPKEAFYQLADAVKASNDPTRIAADLQKVFGRGAAELIPLLKEGGDGLRRAAQESESFADAMARLAPNADRFNDEMARLKQNAAGVSATIMAELVPSLSDTATRVRELLDEDKGIQALVRAFAGLGKLPFDLIFGDIKAASTAQERIKELRTELNDLQGDLKSAQPGGGKSSVLMRSIFGSPEEINQQITVIKNQIAALEKFGDKVYKPKPPAAAQANTGIDFSAAAGKSKAPSIDKTDIYNDEMARNAKLVADETARIRGDYAFMADVDIKQNTAAFKEEWMDAGRALREEMMTPLEQFDQRLEYINELWRVGAIDIETYDRAMAHAFDKTAATGTDAFADLKQTIDGWGKDAAATFADWAMGAETNIADVGRAWVREMIQMAAYKALFEPLANSAGDMVSAIFSAQGNAFPGGTGLSAYRNTVVDRPTTFAFAQGVMGEKIGSPGEAIMPLTRMRGGDLGVKVAGGAPSVTVNVVNNSSGTRVEESESVDSRGNRRVEVVVSDMVAAEVRRSGSGMNSAIRQSFGSSPSLVQR